VGTARALLIKTLTLRDVIRDLAVAWRDDEADVCAALADLLLYSPEVKFFVEERTLLKKNQPKAGYIRVTWSADSAAVEVKLRLAARNGLENVIVNIYRDDKKRSIPLADLIVRKSEIIKALANKPVPQSWLSAPRAQDDAPATSPGDQKLNSRAIKANYPGTLRMAKWRKLFENRHRNGLNDCLVTPHKSGNRTCLKSKLEKWLIEYGYYPTGAFDQVAKLRPPAVVPRLVRFAGRKNQDPLDALGRNPTTKK